MHGKIATNHGAAHVRVAIPSPLRFSPHSDEIALPLYFPEERYELKTYRWDGAAMPSYYMVLSSLSNAEAERLIHKYESEPEEEYRPIQ